jgi:hypothetical protein
LYPGNICFEYRSGCCSHDKGSHYLPRCFYANAGILPTNRPRPSPSRSLPSYHFWSNPIRRYLVCPVWFILHLGSELIQAISRLTCISEISISNRRRDRDGAFVVFLSPSRKVPRLYVKLGQDNLLPLPFRFIIRYHPTIRYINKSLNKCTYKNQ